MITFREKVEQNKRSREYCEGRGGCCNFQKDGLFGKMSLEPMK